MARRFASRLGLIWPDQVTIDIVEFDTAQGVKAEKVLYQNLTATFAEDELQKEVGPFEEIATRAVYVFGIQPQQGQLPEIKESYRVRYDGEDLDIIRVNSSSGSIQEIEVITETGRL